MDVSSAYFKDAEGAVPAVVGDATRLPFATESLDAVFAGDILEHIPDLSKAAAEIARILHVGGAAFVVAPQLYKLDALDLPAVHDIRPSSHLHFMTSQGWQAALEAPGLELSPEHSHALGALSGLLYFSWLQPDFISASASPKPPTDNQRLFSAAKKEASALDPRADRLLQTDSRLAEAIAGRLRQGAFMDAIALLQSRLSGKPANHIDTLRQHYNELRTPAHVETEIAIANSPRLQQIADTPQFIGNSVLLTFIKKGPTAAFPSNQGV